MESPIEIRDQREQEWYWTNNEFIDHFGEIVGTHAVAVYAVLCRHSNNSTQKCWPSMETIGRKAGIKSRKTVSKAIEVLEKHGIVEVEKASAEDGKRLNNIYNLTSPKSWRGAIIPSREWDLDRFKKNPVLLESHDPKTPDFKMAKDSVALPSWMNAEAWAEWVAYRIGIKKKLTPISIRQQIKFLEAHQRDHVEILKKSIMNGWTGLFPLKGETSKAQKVEAPAGKYANLPK